MKRQSSCGEGRDTWVQRKHGGQHGEQMGAKFIHHVGREYMDSKLIRFDSALSEKNFWSKVHNIL